MALLKCKMCGGTLEIEQNETVAICGYCGTQQTLPKLDDERRVNWHDRANHFRRNNEFDKAAGLYEQILNEDTTDAESYWSLVLCRYGIEYVEDPATHRRLPTVNRAQFTSVFDDDNYKLALKYARGGQRQVYEREAKAINEIQKGILAISQKEEPFDVFICYKEMDDHGRRTPDSVLANDLYHQLTAEGFKVFFSRITLEDKLGSAYEPYIFAALNSAKVMVVLGTKAAYFNAVWVKNEWSRYLALIKQGQKKMLIPAYKDMDPYDLPEEFSHLQAQDMSKLGFVQDLIRGIKKIVRADGTADSAVSPLLKRAFMFLEDGEWGSADDYCEKVLDAEPQNAWAYVGKTMVELHVRKPEDLPERATALEQNRHFQKALRFAADPLKTTLASYIEQANVLNDLARLDSAYQQAKNAMSYARTEAALEKAAQMFDAIAGHKDAAEQASVCRKKAEELHKDNILADGKDKMNKEGIENLEAALRLFESIPGWKDANDCEERCHKRIQRILRDEEEKEKEKEEREAFARRKEEEERKRLAKLKVTTKRTAVLVAVAACVIGLLVLIVNTVVVPSGNYDRAVALMEEGWYEEAIAAFEALDGYNDSVAKIEECNRLMYGDEVWNAIKDISVGDTYTFGAYEQDNNLANGKEELEWQVLDTDGARILVVSKYALDYRAYHTSNQNVTWESCELRTWLNTEFLDAAFSAEQQEHIPLTTVSADKNPNYNVSPGKDTEDRVFLLSIVQVNRYFNSDTARQCEPTAYTLSKGVASGGDGSCGWWLRSPGNSRQRAARIYGYGGVYGGGVFGSGDAVNASNAVRPAIWIDLSK